MRLLDLFCGAGGAAMGYSRAGFTEIVGVDIKPQPRYPFDFVQMDALDYAEKFGREFDAVHASPPCQKYSWSAKRWRSVERADLVPDTRRILRWIGEPFVMENVVGAPLIRPITLCGTQFGLGVIRHRLFESDVVLFAPGLCSHAGTVRGGDFVTVAGHGGDNIKGRGSRAIKQAAMGIDWMTDTELNEAIPPAYTEYIGRQLLAVLQAVA